MDAGKTRWHGVAGGLHGGPDVELQVWSYGVEPAHGDPRPGEGRRFIRHLQQSDGCCAQPSLTSEAETGRFLCGCCGMWWSVSHTRGWMAAAKSSKPVGIDVQAHVRRPAALRWLARTARTGFEPSLDHWAVAEAYWKASGNARRRPCPGELHLPELLAAGWGKHSFDGAKEWPYLCLHTDTMALAIVLAGPQSS
jgi:hypothetical protein